MTSRRDDADRDAEEWNEGPWGDHLEEHDENYRRNLAADRGWVSKLVLYGSPVVAFAAALLVEGRTGRTIGLWILFAATMGRVAYLRWHSPDSS